MGQGQSQRGREAALVLQICSLWTSFGGRTWKITVLTRDLLLQEPEQPVQGLSTFSAGSMPVPGRAQGFVTLLAKVKYSSFDPRLSAGV